MTHFPVAVVLPSTTPFNQAAIDAATVELLAPFDEDGHWNAEGTKWDWWVVGGRWRGELIPMEDAPKEAWQLGQSGTMDNPPMIEGGVDILRLRYIDWERMYAARREVVKGWYAEIQKAGDPFGDARDMTEEEYIKARCPFRPHAILQDGKWNEPGEMGWFGIGGEAKESADWVNTWDAFIASSDQDLILVIVDCHV